MIIDALAVTYGVNRVCMFWRRDSLDSIQQKKLNVLLNPVEHPVSAWLGMGHKVDLVTRCAGGRFDKSVP